LGKSSETISKSLFLALFFFFYVFKITHFMKYTLIISLLSVPIFLFGKDQQEPNPSDQNAKIEKKMEFYAYANPIQDRFDPTCILCTPTEDYAATIAFTKHWKITYWMNQAYLGRSLIIAKRHFGNYEEMTNEEAEEYREILRQFLPALKKTFGATHFNVAYLMNQAYRREKPDPPQKDGQPNPHFHWHVIPRYDGMRNFHGQTFEDPDFGNSFDFNRKQYLTGDFQKQVIEAIRANLDIVYLTNDDSK
jgi:diadenosine tetraphosphate (Ap4A) HIT family hydrolase